MPRPGPTRADLEALRAGLRAAGIDPEYWSWDDIREMWRWGHGVTRMVQTAVQREQLARAPQG